MFRLSNKKTETSKNATQKNETEKSKKLKIIKRAATMSGTKPTDIEEITLNPTFYDTLLINFLAIFSTADKPTVFIVIPFFYFCLNLYFQVFDIAWFSVVAFLLYEYVCGNAFYRFCIDFTVYYFLVFAVMYLIKE